MGKEGRREEGKEERSVGCRYCLEGDASGLRGSGMEGGLCDFKCYRQDFSLKTPPAPPPHCQVRHIVNAVDGGICPQSQRF